MPKNYKNLREKLLSTENLDKNLQKIIANIELEVLDVKCGLNHGTNYDDNPLAVDYLCQSFGNTMDGSVDSIIQIPICSECLVSLYSDKQLLYICINCISSQWVFKPESKLTYKDDTKIIFVTYCPKCYEEGLEVKKYEV